MEARSFGRARWEPSGSLRDGFKCLGCFEVGLVCLGIPKVFSHLFLGFHWFSFGFSWFWSFVQVMLVKSFFLQTGAVCLKECTAAEELQLRSRLGRRTVKALVWFGASSRPKSFSAWAAGSVWRVLILPKYGLQGVRSQKNWNRTKSYSWLKSFLPKPHVPTPNQPAAPLGAFAPPEALERPAGRGGGCADGLRRGERPAAHRRGKLPAERAAGGRAVLGALDGRGRRQRDGPCTKCSGSKYMLSSSLLLSKVNCLRGIYLVMLGLAKRL